MSVELVGTRCTVRRFMTADAAHIAAVANERRIWLQLRDSAEIGYWLGAAYWGRQPFAANFASRRVLEKAGYQLEGTMRRSAIKEGEVRDQCLYARLSPGAQGRT